MMNTGQELLVFQQLLFYIKKKIVMNIHSYRKIQNGRAMFRFLKNTPSAPTAHFLRNFEFSATGLTIYRLL